MGVGKTTLVIATVEELAEEFPDCMCVIYCNAASLAEQWRNMISQFTGGTEVKEGLWKGGTDCIVVAGLNPEKRALAYQQVLAERPRYVIIGWSQVTDEFSIIEEIVSQALVQVGDELSVIKNPGSLVSQALKELDSPFIYGLTGTPMENGKPEELFSLMEWVDDSVLGRADIYDQSFVVRDRYGRVKKYVNLDQLHIIMRDACVSRSAEDPDVSPFMPKMSQPKRILIELSHRNAEVYEHIADELCNDLALAVQSGREFNLLAHYAGDSATNEAQGKIMSKISCMRMLCTDPDILLDSAWEYHDAALVKVKTDDTWQTHIQDWGPHEDDKCPAPHHPPRWPVLARKTTKNGKPHVYYAPRPLPGSAYAAELLEQGWLDDLDTSVKVAEVMSDIAELLDDHTDNKVVVFCFHKAVLRKLATHYGARAVRYDGDMAKGARDKAKRSFQTDPTVRLFLSSDAGGFGVDLPQANYLLNLDVPFASGKRVQRNTRIRRTSSQFSRVHVRDYLIEGSIEIYYADITGEKGDVARVVQTGKGHIAGTLKLSPRGLLKWFEDNRV